LQEFHNSYYRIHILIPFLIHLLYSKVSISFTDINHSDMGHENNDLTTVSRKKYFDSIVIESRTFLSFTETAGALSI